jgi:hypothetical protein
MVPEITIVDLEEDNKRVIETDHNIQEVVQL